ncbi:MAG TPA: amidase [Solirubrobacteraceae bacterium]
MGDELWRRGAGELAELIARRETTATEVLNAHIARIDAVNPHVNAIVRRLDDEARTAAQAADRAVAEGAELGPLHGVPFTVKENIDVAGTPTTQAMAVLADAVSPLDAPHVERLRGAGGIPIGRTNLPDLGLRVHTDSSLHGLTRNPWDPGRTAGGSSGGEAAALATGMSPLGLGNDIGGSLRNPAHCCGIASIKPTPGRVPWATTIPPEDLFLAGQLMAVEGVMARRVADVRLGLSIVAGPHVRDPGSLPVPLELPRPDGRLRVALLAEPPGGATDPGIAAVVRAAGDTLADAGYDVVEAVPPSYEAALEVWNRWLITDVRTLMPLLRQIMGPDALRFLDLADAGPPVLSTGEYIATLTERRTIARAWAQFLAGHPLVVCPVWTQPPFTHGFDLVDTEHAEAVFELVRPVLPANLLGLPAAVVCGGRSEGLPVGVQVIGDRFQELMCLEAAQVVEDAVGVLTPIDPVREAVAG